MKKYYDGPDGVFYHQKLDRIFIIRRTHGEMMNLQTGKMLGGVYYFESSEHKVRAAISNKTMRGAIRIGSL